MTLPSLRGLTSRFLLSRLRTARAVARLAFRLHQRKPALIDRRGTLSYAQLQERVLRLQAWMRAQGLRKGDIVFTLLPETGEQYETRLATFENGTVFASFHKHLPPEAALAMIERVRPALFIHDPLLSAPILDAVRARLPGLRLLALGADYEQALAGHAPAWGTEEVGEEDLFALHMTSGTTGLPKAIGYSHRKYLDSMRLIARSIDLRPSGRQRPVHMLGVPLTGPGSGMVLPTLLSGAVLVMPEDFRATTLAALVQQHRVTRAFLSPSAIIDLLDEPALQQYDLSSLTHVPYGSEMMPAPKIAEAIRRFGPIFQQGYGCLEALPPITWLLPHEHVDVHGLPRGHDILSTVGRVMDGVEVVIRDEQFRPLPQGQTGLITVRTPVRFEGYWLDPEKTHETLRDGWVVMGDVGHFDAEGYLHVLGRSADRVQRGGQMLNPREIEEVAHCHPAVKETCLVQHGAVAVLVVSLRQNWRAQRNWQALEHDIAEYLAQHLAPGLQPDDIRVVEEIPRSFLNKMLRREVRLMLEAAPPRAHGHAPAAPTRLAA
ncbi:class I adenylate-forming enzyme family protein [Simplicispira lacusdiani]|uniref:class I adenylate-forming enzyme family protein n=1 Tax=Simplicispira lacusdiani TaxID=2213010 RepID=UPI000E70D7CD|nr:AMP-binding protein [Simplicispira lacusdiani]